MIFLSLIKKPYQRTSHFKNKLKWLVIFTLGNLLINIPFTFLLEFGEDTDLEDFINELNLFQQFTLIAALPAIFEELIFRYPLRLKGFSIGIIFFAAIPISILSLLNLSQTAFYLCGFVLVMYMLLRKQIKLKLSNGKYSTFVFYSISFLFAISHLDNFSNDPLITKVVLVFLALISAIFFGLIRIHIGFKYAVLSHFFYNITIISLSYLVP